MLGLLATLLALALIAWFLSGAPGELLRGHAPAHTLHSTPLELANRIGGESRALGRWATADDVGALLALGLALGFATALPVVRWRARCRRRYVRLRVEAYRTDRASAEAVVGMLEALHKRLLRRWWRRLLLGQPTVALEVHYTSVWPAEKAGGGDGRSSARVGATEQRKPEAGSPRGTTHSAWLAVTCPEGLERLVEAALRTAYPNCRVRPAGVVALPSAVLRLKKQAEFIKRVKTLDRVEHEREPSVNRLITLMGACAARAIFQIALTPAPASYERLAKYLYKRHEARLSRERRGEIAPRMPGDLERFLQLRYPPGRQKRTPHRSPRVCRWLAGSHGRRRWPAVRQTTSSVGQV
jgi:hypothetical protein